MQFFGEPEYVTRVKQANIKGYTYEPELYKDKFDSQTKSVERQKLPRPKSPLISASYD
jgi:hypothetical protein